jgi:hypothetical protein
MMHCHSITVSKEWKIASLSTIGGSCGIMSLRTSRGAKFSRILNRASEALKPLHGLSNRPLTGIVVLVFLMLINGMLRGASVSKRTVHVASARANKTNFKGDLHRPELPPKGLSWQHEMRVPSLRNVASCHLGDHNRSPITPLHEIALISDELSILSDPSKMVGLEIGAAVSSLVVGTIDIIHKSIEIYDAVKDKSGIPRKLGKVSDKLLSVEKLLKGA